MALDRNPVYHIENYGSAMAPFYTTLSLWVGGIVLAAMLKAQVDEATARELAPIRLHELYLGRYAFFALLAFAQATLVCAGDLLFFGIQCAHPLQFLLVGWVAGFVFSNIIYTLTVSFGDVGKALAVVLLVMQVGGSGGTFPIEMTADFFQMVYPVPAVYVWHQRHARRHGGGLRHGVLDRAGHFGELSAAVACAGPGAPPPGDPRERLGVRETRGDQAHVGADGRAHGGVVSAADCRESGVFVTSFQRGRVDRYFGLSPTGALMPKPTVYSGCLDLRYKIARFAALHLLPMPSFPRCFFMRGAGNSDET